MDGQYERRAGGHFGVKDETAVDFLGAERADG